MPFTKHIIEPISIAQCPLPPGEPNELECLSNLTLANVIRQLSSLGTHACRIFDELNADATKINTRSLVLTQRIQNLTNKCSQLDIQNEELSLNDIQTKKQFKSSVKIDQQVVSRKTMPDAMRLMYDNADPPPSLEKLNPYRTDGKDCMKFYTDPEFFFNIWCNELIRDNETRKQEKKYRRRTGKDNNKNQLKSPVVNPMQYNNNNPQLDMNTMHFMQQQQQQQMLQQQQQKIQYDEAYQKHMLLMTAQNKQQILPHQQQQAINIQYYQQQQQQQQIIQQQQNYGNQNENFDEHVLPPPPLNLLQDALPPPPQQHADGNLNNYQVYAESTQLNNGTRLSKIAVQQVNIMNNRNSNQSIGSGDRPGLPPPPIPDHAHQMSDLQQMQHQMMRKFDNISIGIKSTNSTVTNGNINNHHHHDMISLNNNGAELPPPPSPPDFTDLNSGYKLANKTAPVEAQKSTQQTISIQQQMHIQLQLKSGELNADNLDLPPPPLDMNEMLAPSPTSLSKQTHFHPSLPQQPPPPIPISMSNGEGVVSSGKTTSTSSPKKVEEKSGRSFLDDINKGRFTLKPTQRNEILVGGATGEDGTRKTNSFDDTNSSRDTLQPFVNNSDVAAIIDFVRKFRPHVCDSSEDDETSDWDD